MDPTSEEGKGGSTMNTKIIAVIASIGLALSLGLVACGGGGASSASSSSASSQKTELTGDQMIDAAFAACPIDENSAFDVAVSAVHDGVAGGRQDRADRGS